MPDEAREIHRERTTGAGPEDVRRRNLSAILRRVHVVGPSSRSDLAAHTGLNRSTVGALVADLAARRLVRERRPTRSGVPGRPSPVVEPRPDGVAVLALEIFADSLAVATIGLGGRVLARTRVDRIREPATPEATVEALATIARPLVNLAGDAPRIIGVGVAVAGAVRREDGFLAVAPNLGWHDVPLAALVRSRLAVDAPILVGNDGELATLAEHIRGAGVGCDDFLCLWGEAGVGAGIIAGGRPLTGRSGFAGEVGHLPVNPEGRLCHCGARGCWETEAGEEALLRLAGWTGQTAGRHSIEALLADAELGDPNALEALAGVGRWLGIGLAGLVNVLDPGRIALGGLLARTFQYIREPIERELQERRMTDARGPVEVVPARLGVDGPLIGAAELAFASFIADPATVPFEDRPSSTARPRPRGAKEVKPVVLAI